MLCHFDFLTLFQKKSWPFDMSYKCQSIFGFSILCHFDTQTHFSLRTFGFYVILTFLFFVLSYFELWSFQSYVFQRMDLSIILHFAFRPFRPFDSSPIAISTFRHFVPISFLTLVIVLGHFDFRLFAFILLFSNIGLFDPFRPFYVLNFGRFDIVTFPTNVIMTF